MKEKKDSVLLLENYDYQGIFIWSSIDGVYDGLVDCYSTF